MGGSANRRWAAVREWGGGWHQALAAEAAAVPLNRPRTPWRAARAVRPASYPAPDSCDRDSDNSEFVYFNKVGVLLASTVAVQVNVLVNVDALENGELEHQDLEVNAGNDLWFSAAKIEVIYDAEPDG